MLQTFLYSLLNTYRNKQEPNNNRHSFHPGTFGFTYVKDVVRGGLAVNCVVSKFQPHIYNPDNVV